MSGPISILVDPGASATFARALDTSGNPDAPTDPAAAPRPVLRRLTLPYAQAPRLLWLLAIKGVTPQTVWPGLAGVARALAERRLWDVSPSDARRAGHPRQFGGGQRRASAVAAASTSSTTAPNSAQLTPSAPSQRVSASNATLRSPGSAPPIVVPVQARPLAEGAGLVAEEGSGSFTGPEEPDATVEPSVIAAWGPEADAAARGLCDALWQGWEIRRSRHFLTTGTLRPRAG